MSDLRREVAAACGWVDMYDERSVDEHGARRGDMALHGNHATHTYADGSLMRAPVPDYVNDIAACIAELDRLPVDWTPRLVRILVPKGEIAYEWKCMILHNETHEQIESYDVSAAVAVCEALIAWYKREAT